MARKDTKLKELARTVSEMADDMRGGGLDALFFSEFGQMASGLQDSRQQTKVRHRMDDVVAIVFFALLSDIDEWTEMEYFAIDQRDVLGKYLSLPNGIPSHDTLERVVAIIKPEELQDMLVGVLRAIITRAAETMGEPLYTNEELGISITDVVAIDGKETRGTGVECATDETERRNLNELNVQSTEYGITLSSTRIGEKTNEIPEAQKVLKRLELKGCVVTADALNTQKETAKAIVDHAHADYCLALKENQRNAHADVADYFHSPETLEDLRKGQNTYIKEEEEVSGQKIIREYYMSSEIKWFEDLDEWTGLLSFGYEKKTVMKPGGEECHEERFFLCSFPADADLLSIVVRRHWHVENLLHWILDVTFKEDSLSTRNKKALHNLGLIRRFVLSLLKALKEYYGNMSYRYMRRRIGRTFEKQITVIFSVFKVLYDQGCLQ